MQLLVLLMCLTTIHQASSLHCYVTSPDNIVFDGQPLPETIQDCRHHIDSNTALRTSDDKSPSCYRHDFIIEGNNYALKTCTEKEYCGILGIVLEYMFAPSHKVEIGKCHECNSDECNTGHPTNNSAKMKYDVRFGIAILALVLLIEHY